jgi:hypothetical protein
LPRRLFQEIRRAEPGPVGPLVHRSLVVGGRLAVDAPAAKLTRKCV